MRFSTWGLLAFVFYAAAAMLPVADGGAWVQLQTALWKVGHITAGAYIGFWIDRHALGKLLAGDDGQRKLSRAILMAAGVLAMAMGL